MAKIQKIVFDREISDPIPVNSRLPQGTILGPFMFLLYAQDPENPR